MRKRNSFAFFIYTSYVHTFNDYGVFFHQTHPYIDADFYLFICLYIYTYINMLPTVAQISCEHNKLSLLLISPSVFFFIINNSERK